MTCTCDNIVHIMFLHSYFFLHPWLALYNTCTLPVLGKFLINQPRFELSMAALTQNGAENAQQDPFITLYGKMFVGT